MHFVEDDENKHSHTQIQSIKSRMEKAMKRHSASANPPSLIADDEEIIINWNDEGKMTSSVCTEKRKETALKEATKDELLGKLSPIQVQTLACPGKEQSRNQAQGGKNSEIFQNKTACT